MGGPHSVGYIPDRGILCSVLSSAIIRASPLILEKISEQLDSETLSVPRSLCKTRRVGDIRISPVGKKFGGNDRTK